MSRKFTPQSVLITQGELVNYAGSEIVTLELAEHFHSLGVKVHILANFIDRPIQPEFTKLKGLTLHTTADTIDFESLDLIWIHHQLIPPVMVSLAEAGKLKAKVIFHHMSPFHPLEFSFSARIEKELADAILFNSPETKRAIEEPLQSLDFTGHVFGNPAPDSFKASTREVQHAKSLSRILIVSNHIPPEVLDAVKILKRTAKVSVKIYGGQGGFKRVTKQGLKKHDVVITIGKTVQYGLLAGVPVYCYDHFGGPGYLTKKNFELAADLNFSGRGFEKKSAELIADELLSEYEQAKKFARYAHKNHIQKYLLSKQVETVFETISKTSKKSVKIPAVDKAIFNSLPKHFWSEHIRYRAIHKELSQHNEQLRNEISRLTKELTSTYQSFSWKLTHGLRQANHYVKRAKDSVQNRRAIRHRKPKIVALFSYRYDAALVPDFLKNIDFVDDYVAFDDTKNKNLWFHNGERHKLLLKEARKRKADWVLCVDPDERFEKTAAKKIRQIVASTPPGEKVIYGFHWRELHEPNAYRVDGVWGTKTKFALFPLLPGQKFMNRRIHSQWPPINADYRHQLLDINLYHLKHINPENGKLRSNLYKKLDPTNKYQKIGYEYIADTSDMKLRRVPVTRNYTPKYNPEHTIVQHD